MSLNPQCWYTSTIPPLPKFPTLEGEQQADICIVGAGITGCTAAAALAGAGLSVRVIEAGTIAFGASGRSGGQIIPGSALPFFPRDDSRRPLAPPTVPECAAWEAGVEAVRIVRSVIETYGIDCDYAPTGHLRVAVKPRHVGELEILARLMDLYGHTGLRWYGRSEMGDVAGSGVFQAGLLDPMGGHLNPLKYVVGLARAATTRGAVFHENTPYLAHSVQSDGTVVVKTPWSQLRTRWLIIAGNAYLWERGQVPMGTALPVETFMVATEPLGADLAGSLIPGNQSIMDIQVSPHRFRRTPDHRLLMGGVITGATVDPFNLRYVLRDKIREYFPQIPKETRITHAWGGPLSITRNRLPHLGRLERQVLFAHGFSGQGIALATQAGDTLAKVVVGADSRMDVMEAIPHAPWPMPKFLRTPSLLLAFAALRLQDKLADFSFYRAQKQAEKAAAGSKNPES